MKGTVIVQRARISHLEAKLTALTAKLNSK